MCTASRDLILQNEKIRENQNKYSLLICIRMSLECTPNFNSLIKQADKLGAMHCALSSRLPFTSLF